MRASNNNNNNKMCLESANSTKALQCRHLVCEQIYGIQEAQLSQRPRNASCLSVVSFNIPTAWFFYYQLLRLQIY